MQRVGAVRRMSVQGKVADRVTASVMGLGVTGGRGCGGQRTLGRLFLDRG